MSMIRKSFTNFCKLRFQSSIPKFFNNHLPLFLLGPTLFQNSSSVPASLLQRSPTTSQSIFSRFTSLYRSFINKWRPYDLTRVRSFHMYGSNKLSESANLEGILLGIGNPLLDISVQNVERDFLDKYNLKTGDAVMADNKHLSLFEELPKFPQLFFSAGGAAQNTIRATQWMMQTPASVASFIGCVGDDHYGDRLRTTALESGIKCHYMTNTGGRTGVCAVLVTDSERSLVAHLGAAESYHSSHFDSPEIQKVVEKAKYYYSEGFFVVVSHDTLMKLGQHSSQNNKHFLLNLSAPFLIQSHWEKLEELMPYTDVVICNETEAITVGEKLNLGADFFAIAKFLADFPKANEARPRLVIFTQGVKPTLVYRNGELLVFPLEPVNPRELVDTNGAGDSFVGGFLSGYITGKTLEECVERGHYCAKECVKQHGASWGPKPNFNYKNPFVDMKVNQK